MFGLSKEERERRKAAEQALIERVVSQSERELLMLKDAKPPEAERLHSGLRDRMKDPKLPKEFRQKVRELAKHLDCASNMRAADAALQMAMLHGKADRKPERAAFLKEGRGYVRKAVSLGAGEDFQRGADTLIEVIMMSGNVSARGKATRAKPGETAPAPPELAKVSDEKLEAMVRTKLAAIRAAV